MTKERIEHRDWVVYDNDEGGTTARRRDGYQLEQLVKYPKLWKFTAVVFMETMREILVEGDDFDEAIENAEKIHIEGHKPFQRCSICNELLIDVPYVQTKNTHHGDCGVYCLRCLLDNAVNGKAHNWWKVDQDHYEQTRARKKAEKT